MRYDGAAENTKYADGLDFLRQRPSEEHPRLNFKLPGKRVVP
jgi:hypothetical protein